MKSRKQCEKSIRISDHDGFAVANPRNNVRHAFLLTIFQEIKQLSWKLITSTSSRGHCFFSFFFICTGAHAITTVCSLHWISGNCETGGAGRTEARGEDNAVRDWLAYETIPSSHYLYIFSVLFLVSPGQRDDYLMEEAAPLQCVNTWNF